MSSSRSDVPRFADPAQASELRARLEEVGFTDGAVLERIGFDEAGGLRDEDAAALTQRTAGGTPLDTLIRLLLMGTRVPRRLAAEALARPGLEASLEAGLVEDVGADTVRSPLRLLPFRGGLLAFDPPERARVEGDSGYVMGVGRSTLLLSSFLVREPAERALDLGTGCGTLALEAAGHADRVVGTDRNPRALAFAAFNAALNGAANVDWREGSLFEPVAGERFDRIVSNPPFVISPARDFVYRDGGLPGDGLVASLVGQVGGYLREGGYAQILCNWLHRKGEPWEERLSGWAAGTGCDAWVLCSETRDPETYARTWIAHTHADDPARQGERLAEWMAYYEHLGVEAISAGLFQLRRREAGRSWFRGEPAPPRLLGNAGAGVVRGFAVRDLLAGIDSRGEGLEPLLELPLRPSSSLELDTCLRMGEGGWVQGESRLRQTKGLAYEGPSDPVVAEVLAALARRGRLRPAAQETASALGLDGAALIEALLPVVRRLLEQDLLEIGELGVNM